MYYVYIIYSASHDVYYKGYTLGCEKRLEEHNEGKSKYTSGKGPWLLVFVQEYEQKTDALKREKQLKRQHRKYLEWLIGQDVNLVKANEL